MPSETKQMGAPRSRVDAFILAEIGGDEDFDRAIHDQHDGIAGARGFCPQSDLLAPVSARQAIAVDLSREFSTSIGGRVAATAGKCAAEQCEAKTKAVPHAE